MGKNTGDVSKSQPQPRSGAIVGTQWNVGKVYWNWIKGPAWQATWFKMQTLPLHQSDEKKENIAGKQKLPLLPTIKKQMSHLMLLWHFSKLMYCLCLSKCSVCMLLMLGSASSENSNIFQPVLTYMLINIMSEYTQGLKWTLSFLLFMSWVIPCFFLFIITILWSSSFPPFLRSPLNHSSCTVVLWGLTSCTTSTTWLWKLQFHSKQFFYLLVRDNLAQNWIETSIL